MRQEEAEKEQMFGNISIGYKAERIMIMSLQLNAGYDAETGLPVSRDYLERGLGQTQRQLGLPL